MVSGKAGEGGGWREYREGAGGEGVSSAVIECVCVCVCVCVCDACMHEYVCSWAYVLVFRT